MNKNTNKYFKGLTKEQMKAVKYEGRNLLLVACPGAGKTRTLLTKLYYLNYVLGENKKAAVITFTKACAEEMKKRYIKNINNYKDKTFFGTFHSFFYRLMLSYGFKMKVIDEEAKNKIIDNILKKKNLEGFNVSEVLNTMNKKRNCIIESIKKEYEVYKKENKVFDFDDIEEKFLNEISTHKEFLDFCRKKYDYYFVDEFQDTNNNQISILKKLTENKYLFAVGDEDQCIYSFRGAEPDIMVKFKDEFYNGEKLYLTKNFRSGESIIKSAQKLISNNKIRNVKEMIPGIPKSSVISFKNAENNAEYLNILKDIILKNIEELSDTAVLYRTNKESSLILDMLLSNNIPFKFIEGKFHPSDYYIFRDILSYFKLSQNPFDYESGISIINKPLRGISKLCIEKILSSKFKEPFSDLLIKNCTNILSYRNSMIFSFKINILKRLNPYEGFLFILYILGYKKYLKKKCIREEVNFKIYKYILKNSKKFFKEAKTFKEAEEKWMNNFNNKNGVLLSTIHGVKGMEFKNVIIVNCNEGNIPHHEGVKMGLEEERRIFYVGITRTIEKLYIIWQKKMKKEHKQASRFVEEMGRFVE